MLPTTGHFKNINCPFYETCICERPYCHFKHAKKETNDTNLISEIVSKAVHKVLNLNPKSDTSSEPENETISVTSITYNPTPIAELNKIKGNNNSSSVINSLSEKKSRHIPIQYSPEQPRSSRSATNISEYKITPVGYSPSVKNYTPVINYVPSAIKALAPSTSNNETNSTDSTSQKVEIYVPSSIPSSSNSYTNVESPSSIKYEPTSYLELIDNVSKDEYVPKYNDEFIDEFLNDPNIYEPTEITPNKEIDRTNKNDLKDKPKESSSTKTTQQSDNKLKNKHTHTSRSSKHKHKDSNSKVSSSKHSSKDKHGHKSKDSHVKNGYIKNSKSSSVNDTHSKNKTSVSHKSTSRDKHKSSSDSKSKSKHSEKNKYEKLTTNMKVVKPSEKIKSSDKSKSGDKVKPINKDKHKNKQHKEDVHETQDEDDEDDEELYIKYISDEYESDEMEQCKRIFEEYQPPVEVPQPKISLKTESENVGLSKKRVAYEKSSGVVRDRIIKPIVKTPAMVMSERYKLLKEKIEKQGKETGDLMSGLKKSNKDKFLTSDINNTSLENNELLQILSTEKHSKPGINVSTSKYGLKRPIEATNITAKMKRIAHVPNVSSLLNAKKKVEEQTKLISANKTPVQTIAKGSKRVAHIPEQLDILDTPSVLQSEKSKLPLNIRNRYLFLMIKECVRLYVTKQAAYDRALNEELNCYTKCSAINTYRNSVMLSINRLRKEAVTGENLLNGVLPHGSNLSEFEGIRFYHNLFPWVLSEQELLENGYPRPGASAKGHAIFKSNKILERIPEKCQLCVRCKKIFKVDVEGFPMFIEDCIYHPYNRVVFRGETKYICCQQPSSSDGCCVCHTHVFEVRDPNELSGFVKTFEPDDDNDPRSSKIYGIDCEMVYTTRGLELARVTVIDSKFDVILDSLVKPMGSILDYNTKFSGLTMEMLKNVTKNITEIQATLLLLFNSKTILVGHSLESDLKALRIIHSTVIDTSVLFPHKMGPPRKRALRSLASDYLKKIIQNSESGHDSAEDAVTCIELLIWKLKEELKTR